VIFGFRRREVAHYLSMHFVSVSRFLNAKEKCQENRPDAAFFSGEITIEVYAAFRPGG
jgi:hypothetical protein